MFSGTYLIGAFNVGRTPTSFTLFASSDSTPVLAPAGAPLYAMVELGQPAFFRYKQAGSSVIGEYSSSLLLSFRFLSSPNFTFYQHYLFFFYALP